VSERYLIQLTITKSAHDRLLHAQALLSHAVPTGDLAQVFGRALDALIEKLERRKLGAVNHRPRRQQAGGHSPGRPSPRGRYVPVHIRRAVWERDQGQCTFVSSRGNRCKASRFLEFDHVDPVARGGGATVDRIRLRCRAHNQYEAERAFGAAFMSRKRREARLAAAEARARAADERATAERATAEEEAAAKEQAAREQVRDVFAGLRNLGCRANEARRAAELSGTLQDATLEERMRAALKFLSPGSVRASTSAESPMRVG
jgi:5-methylcytosine-specific restriction endonuclease McrA